MKFTNKSSKKEKKIEKIDFVITWVDGSDPQWQQLHDSYASKNTEYYLKQWNDSKERYRDWNLLKYWFRGVEKFAPWVNKIHFVTCGQIPEWLNTTNPKLNLVNHTDFIPKEYLPTFSSHCIELNLHKIPNLEENFVYFNDDMFLIAPTNKKDFFINGIPRDCAALQPIRMVQNGIRAEINNMYLINSHFVKNKTVNKNLSKWFSLKYGKLLIHTLLMLPYSTFPGFYISHLPISYNKKTCRDVWNLNSEVLQATCNHKFRTSTDVNQWIFQFWQFVQGNFIPRSPSFGHMYEGVNYLQQTCLEIRKQKYKVICWNDCNNIEDFKYAKDKIQTAFNEILPNKSSFEK